MQEISSAWYLSIYAQEALVPLGRRLVFWRIHIRNVVSNNLVCKLVVEAGKEGKEEMRQGLLARRRVSSSVRETPQKAGRA